MAITQRVNVAELRKELRELKMVISELKWMVKKLEEEMGEIVNEVQQYFDARYAIEKFIADRVVPKEDSLSPSHKELGGLLER